MVIEKERERKRIYNESPRGKQIRLRCERNYNESPKGKENRRKQWQKRRARKLNVDFWEPWMDIVWEQMKIQTNGYCPLCHKFIGVDKLTMDHIIPLSKGGIHRIDNVQPMCGSCNSKKSNKLGL